MSTEVSLMDIVMRKILDLKNDEDLEDPEVIPENNVSQQILQMKDTKNDCQQEPGIYLEDDDSQEVHGRDSEEDAGIVLKSEECPKCPGIYSPALLHYYAMRQKE